MTQCPKCNEQIAMLAIKCDKCGYDFPEQSYDSDQHDVIGGYFTSYILFVLIYFLVVVMFVFGSGDARASAPSNLFSVIYLAWGYIGLASVNILLSIYFIIANSFKRAAILFVSALPLVIGLLILLLSSL